MLINEQNSFMLDFLTSMGYKFDDNEFKSLTNQETGETANLACFKSIEGNMTYTYQFKYSKIILEQNYSENFKEDLIKLVTPEMIYSIRNTRYKDTLPNREVSFSANNGIEAELKFSTNSNDFDKTTMTTIKHRNSNGGTYLACEISSDLTHLNYQPYDLRAANYSIDRMYTTDISEATYFKYIIENLGLIFGRSIDKQEYETMNKVVLGLSDNVRIMLDSPINNSKRYLENLQYHLSHLNEKYTEKFGQLLQELESERAKYLQILDNYNKTLNSLNTETHRNK